ncbi:formate dehydrogenase accessory sulfurtransferase FdhD [Bradyrhizobium sp.]|uniref:formate dehydrogenase accessory sulfurtransferase FdhD n=1 Tax=unclassified Bradyrhizobium TaxID=2631580 RepID=UPI002110B537|nr:formate dehydrogenase accessory sulfurtransferase FdhD [Bradyrhizobium sp.]
MSRATSPTYLHGVRPGTIAPLRRRFFVEGGSSQGSQSRCQTNARGGRRRLSRPGWRRTARTLAEETPVTVAYNGTTLAVVMATPADHIDLALGFSLTEGILAAPSEIEDLDIVRHEDSVELRVLLTSDRGDRLSARRRRLVGPTGCGL